MATDYIVRLQGQDNLSGTIDKVKKSLQEVGGATSKIDQIRQKFQKVEASTAPLRKKLKDVKFQMEQLAATGDTSSELFKEMAKAAKNYQDALDKVNSSIKNVTDSSGKMNDGMKGLDFKGIAGDIASSSGFGNIGKALGAIATPAGAATAAVAAVGVVMVKAGKAAADFETHLDSLQALTGLDNDSMKAISDGAVEMSKEFKSSASDIVDAMKLIGSQAPELLKDKDALMEVTKAANVLSEAAQIEVVDAAKGITTVMNQMGVSASEASNIINVLAASSQQGSADVAYLNSAFEKSGTAAKGAGMNYTELAAMIETIAPKFSSADVAGSKLASTLLKLSLSGEEEFTPAVVGMKQALENLSKAELDDAAIKDLVGESNVTMLKTLIEGKDTFNAYADSLAGTNTAFEQMAINNDNFEGAVTKLSSAWEAFLITLGQSGVLQGIADNIMDLMGLLMDIINVISDIIKAFDLFGDDVTDNVNVSKKQIELLSSIIKGIGTALQIVIGVAAKVFNGIKEVALNAANGIRNKWNELKASLSDNAFVQNISKAWTTIYNKAVEIIGKVKKLWNDFLKWLGLEGKSTSVPSPIKDDTTPSTATTSATTNESATNEEDGKGKKGKTSKTKTTTKKEEKPKTQLELDREAFDKVSKEAREAISDFNAGLISKEDLEAAVKRANDYFKDNNLKANIELEYKDEDGFEKVAEKKVEKKKEKEIKPEKPKAKEGSLADIQKQLQDKQAAIKLEVYGSDEYNRLRQEIADLTDKEHLIKLQIDNDGIKSQFEMLESYKTQMENLSGVIDSIGSSFSSLGNAIGGTGGKVMEFLGTTAQGISQLIPQIVSLITAQEAEAIAAGTASGAAMPFPANIAAIAAIVATVTGIFASLAGSFADGGIVGGASMHGDRLLAKVNSGEMILNGRQQANLFNALDGTGIAANFGGNVKFEIDGRVIKGVLNNVNSKINKQS